MLVFFARFAQEGKNVVFCICEDEKRMLEMVEQSFGAKVIEFRQITSHLRWLLYMKSAAFHGYFHTWHTAGQQLIEITPFTRYKIRQEKIADLV